MIKVHIVEKKDNMVVLIWQYCDESVSEKKALSVDVASHLRHLVSQTNIRMITSRTEDQKKSTASSIDPTRLSHTFCFAT